MVDDVLQLADVPRPGIGTQLLRRLRAQLALAVAQATAVFGDEVAGQRQDVAGSLAQRRQFETDDIEPVVQVLAEVPGIDRPLQLHVGRRQHAHVDGDALARPQAHHLALLQHAQQLDLDRHRQVADLVEEQVPPLASSNQPALAARAPVKAPFSWPNSSASTSDSEKAPQLTATNGPLRRALRLWICRATSSLPVPVSPITSTLASLGATWRRCSSRAWDFGSSKTWAVARIEVARFGERGSVSSRSGVRVEAFMSRRSVAAVSGSAPSRPARGSCSPAGRAGSGCAGCASSGPGAGRREWSGRR